jgi:exo-1,4-beta-D-glucosaminidase
VASTKTARLILGAVLLALGCEGPPVPPSLCPITPSSGTSTITLSDGWWLRSSDEVIEADIVIASAGLSTLGWHPTLVPSTVVAALVADGSYPDPFPAMNLRSMPGVDYPIGGGFGNLEMSDTSPFWDPWWYRTEFDWPANEPGRHAWLRLDGVNHRAALYLNGRVLATEDELVGTFRRFEYEVTSSLTSCGKNALALRVRAQRLSDLGWNFVDWNPFPPDKDMGLWRPVSIHTTGAVRLRWPRISSELDGGAGPGARLTVRLELENAEDSSVDATIVIAIVGQPTLRVPVTLNSRELREVVLEPDQHPELVMSAPRLWWPRPLGEPALYDAKVSVEVGGATSDTEPLRFGVRQVTSELTAENWRLFRVNGKALQIRGAGWTPDMLLREPDDRIATDVAYVRDMNLNAIRLEGKEGFPALYDRADEQGILVLAGWCCCDRWEMWSEWDEENRRVAPASLRDQARELAAHPSILAWLNGSDNAPDPEPEQVYHDVLVDVGWPNPALASANSTDTPVYGHSGLKMSGPYRWVPPSYWSTDTDRGGAFGFNSETSAGGAIPPLESLRKFIPTDHDWPVDDVWRFHSDLAPFVELGNYGSALDARYGPAGSMEDYAKKSQLAAYEGVRAMFEAYGRRKYLATGVIQWMLNNAWPGLIWHLYDVYLKPGGGYFGAKIANAPLHAQYGYDDRAISIVNHRPTGSGSLIVSARVFDPAGAELHAMSAAATVAADEVRDVLTLPSYGDLPRTHLLVVDLSEDGAPLTRDVYWLSTTEDVLDWNWNDGNGWVTPTIGYADLTGLSSMPLTSLALTAARTPTGARVTLTNAGSTIAFFDRVELAASATSDEIVPVRWSDNYVTLLPGETRTLDAEVMLPAGALVARHEGWNVAAGSVTVAP